MWDDGIADVVTGDPTWDDGTADVVAGIVQTK